MNKLLIAFLLFSSCRVPADAQKSNDSSFRELPMVLNTADASIYGTLTLPKSQMRKLTVCLIISGSGPTDRNGNNPAMKNDGLKMFALALADSGIASLRYDKRGIGESVVANLKESELRFQDFVRDAEGWVAELKNDKRFNRIVIAGHSEGSLIGMIAAQKDANGFISLAGAGKPAGQLIADQLSIQAPMLTKEANIIIDSLEAGKQVTKINPMLAGLFRTSVQPYLISWFSYNPADKISQLKIPVLIIQGDEDLQVSKSDADKLFAASKFGEEQIIPQMNHILKKVSNVNSDNLASYNDPTRPLHPNLIPAVIKFIKALP